MAMDSHLQSFFDRVVSTASEVRDLSGISEWMIRNTRDPRNPAKPWSFKDHEFQIDILNDAMRQVVVSKCSQVGLSEITVRLQLALLTIFPTSTSIYTLPTTSFARQFTKTRIDPVIDASPELSAMVPGSNDSSELKQLGTSFLYVRGSFGQGAAISIPADILINDEVDFSNPKAMTTFASRLGHADAGGIHRQFSTPTVEGYGITKAMTGSSRARYMVKHEKCGQWVAPDWFDDLVIPGFDRAIIEFDSYDYYEEKYDVRNPLLMCPHCRHPITQSNLMDASKRQWVHEFPDKEVHGYQVMPFDVAKYNPVAKTLSHIVDYDRKADWVNFKIGLPFEDAETAFLLDRIKQAERITPVIPVKGAANGCVMGVDIGKQSWVTVGYPGRGKLEVIHKERVTQGGNHELTDRLQELMDYYGVVKCVIDAAPDFTTALTMIEKNYVGRVYGCYYVRSVGNKLTTFIVNDAESVISADRTGTIDALAKAVNGGSMLFSKDNEQETVRGHLQALKRVTQTNNQGEQVNSWVSTGDDHYGHSLNYLNIANGLLEHKGKGAVTPSLPLPSKTRLKSGHGEGEEVLPLLKQGKHRRW